MKRRIFLFFLASLSGSAIACLLFFFLLPHLPVAAHTQGCSQAGAASNYAITTQSITAKLRTAPWQGVRYLNGQNEWRFYGLVGESSAIEMIYPVKLVKIYYLTSSGEVSYTWAATEIDFSGKTTALTSQPVEKGDLVAVRLMGEYVSMNGVAWELCETETCRLAQAVDSLIILDDKGTGISNAFIRYGWEPPALPRYGFLCWQIDPVQTEDIMNLEFCSVNIPSVIKTFAKHCKQKDGYILHKFLHFGTDSVSLTYG